MHDLMALEAELPTIKGAALAKIEHGMIEQRRVARIFGRQNSQTTAKLMSLTMLAAAPHRQLRQCAAEIEKRNLALAEHALRLKRSSIEAAQARADAELLTGCARELRLLDAQDKEHQIAASRTYVEGALKDIAALQDAYEQIRQAAGIRENWDEADFEAGELEHHLKAAFQLAYRDVMQTGHLGGGALEYLQQFGVHPQVAQQRVLDYLASVHKLMAARKAPTIDHFHDWLESCYQMHRNDVQRAVARLGLVDLITKYSLYVEPE